MVDDKLRWFDKGGRRIDRTTNDLLSAASPTDVRIRNRTAVLRAMYSGRKRSRSELASITGLSKVSTSDVVADLMDEGYLTEGGYKSSARPGKPALMLEFNPSAASVIAVDLSETNEIVGAVVDLDGRILCRERRELPSGRGLSIDQVIGLCRVLVESNRSPLLGIGVATPGFVDEHGVVLDAPNLGWKNVDIVGLLERHFGCGVSVANDADCAVFAERCFANGSPSMMYVQIAKGVGAGLLVADQVVHGVDNTAGEIGHVVVDPEGLPCLCGKRGCLETLIAVPSLERQMSEHPEKRCEIITHAGHVLGNALAMVVAMTGVTDVVVSGPENLVDSSFRQATERCINDLVHSRFIDVVKVRDSRFQGDTALLGAVATVLRRRLNLL
ncbi:Sugar kinase of the NBD/HSP70 family, may contain an N-terminal HTH domain [Bifidobacterium bohemicum]|uniref:ROK family transcriptional regulator n=1 Tax=Bifidobacterium bohemicum DSM 22767 TaxID=1437606 RepID=A0A086ZKA7_9BIFI|nr:ROK family protein [Bifidobacterium bohemicum]KFI46957.1 ROK family transcriptional regulator [Bifidobacterium bohemicum DSM 22767]SCB86174.1 Sugar kinase of the NBD/HSP70 family, may contain an N-terminal HTH domain [Bifidobacterium bohemicum]